MQRLLTLALAVSALVWASFQPAVQSRFPAAVEVEHAVVEGWALLAPGGKLHPASFIEHRGHLFVEGLLLFVISYLLFQGSYKPRAKDTKPLTEKVRSGCLKCALRCEMRVLRGRGCCVLRSSGLSGAHDARGTLGCLLGGAATDSAGRPLCDHQRT